MTDKPEFKLKINRRHVPDKELLADVARAAAFIKRNTITMAEYEAHGNYHPSTLVRRFGGWPKVLIGARLQPSRSQIGIPDEDLFANLADVWTKLGRQPVYNEIFQPLSKYSAGTYENRFGTWNNSLQAFEKWANHGKRALPKEEDDSSDAGSRKRKSHPRRTRRDISERMRFNVLMRDGFCCQACGASPSKTRGVELHVDHIVPWSMGGETVLENLQTKCAKCNLGKGNAFKV